MKILVNALPLRGLVTGIARYVRCLYSQFEDMLGVNIFYFTGKRCQRVMPVAPEVNKWIRNTSMIWKLPDAVVTILRSVFWLRFEERLRGVVKDSDFDVYHETAFFPAAIREVPVVFTLYDLSLLKYPQWHPKERVWFFNLFFKNRLMYASHILTLSEYMRNEIVGELCLSSSQVTAVPLAVDPVFWRRDRESVRGVLKTYSLPEEYILFVGTIEPRKNLYGLLKALSILETDVPLVIAGWEGWGDNGLRQHLSSLKNRVFFTHYVDEETLASLYSGALAFVYPSFYEGFGLPVLEAMACGCPVVCSNVSSLPEVAGDAALLIDPQDIASIAWALEKVLQDSQLRSCLVERGLNRVRMFSWKKTARKTLEVFRIVRGTS